LYRIEKGLEDVARQGSDGGIDIELRKICGIDRLYTLISLLYASKAIGPTKIGNAEHDVSKSPVKE
jgi:hypothetical protein